MSTIDTKDYLIMDKFIAIEDDENGKAYLKLADFSEIDIIETYNGAINSHEIELMVDLMKDYLELLNVNPNKKYGKVFLKNLQEKYQEFMNTDVRGRLFIYLFMVNAYKLKQFLVFTERRDEQELA